MTTEAWIAAIVAILGAGALITYKVTQKNSHNKSINQNNNSVTNGDIIGGDKTTK